MKNIVVLVSGGGTNFQAIIDAIENGNIENGKISLVISSNENAYALTRAKEHNIDSLVLKRKDYADISSYSLAVRDALIDADADLVVFAGFMSILDEQVASAFPNKMINIHPSLIPSFCGKGFYGLHVHEAVLASGVKLTGATVHFVTEVCDGGAIIMQKSVPVERFDTPEILQERVMRQAEHIMLPKVVSLFCDDKIIVENGKAYII